ncbi:MAG: phosphoglycolate phosphatase [Stappiaceae bacterium]
MTGLLIFDLDGTLVDTAPDLVGTLNWVLQEQGIGTVPLEQARNFIGQGARAMLKMGFNTRGISLSGDQLETHVAQFLEHYQANISQNSRPFPGVLDAMNRFSSAGWQLAVCTNKLEHLAVKLLNELDLAQRFSIITGGDTFEKAKPDPTPILGTMSKLNSSADEAIMVGDARPDIDGARNAGIPSIAVDFGYTTEPVASLNPDRIISHFDDLWDSVHNIRA